MSSSEKLKLELQKVRDEFKMSESDCGSARVQGKPFQTCLFRFYVWGVGKIKYHLLHKALTPPVLPNNPCLNSFTFCILCSCTGKILWKKLEHVASDSRFDCVGQQPFLNFDFLFG